MRLLYRARQFWHDLGARPDQHALKLASGVLTPAQMALFRNLQPGEQAHAIKVFSRLLMQSEEHPDLLAAALLHDCGKQLSPINPLQRAWIVIAQTLFPARVKQWGQVERERLPGLPAWRRALAVAEQHPLWGAELARQAGASPLLQALIRRHQERLNHHSATLEDELIHKLQVVDNES
jgi:exopolyphosphatase/pppGpp-phosphohydrolase